MIAKAPPRRGAVAAGASCLVVGLHVGACAVPADDSTTVTTVDSAGIQIVEHAASGFERPHPMHLSTLPLLSIGSVSDEASALYRVRGLTRTSHGTILVANSGSGEVRVFNAAGDFSHAVGGFGVGPGEFTILTAVGVSPGDDLLTYDRATGRVSRFESSSPMLTGTVTLRQSTTNGGNPLLRPTAVGWLHDGTLVGYVNTIVGGEEAVVRDENGWFLRKWDAHLHYYDSSGVSLKALVTMPGRQRLAWSSRLSEERVRIRGVSMPFLPSFQAATDGDIVAVANTRRYDISVLDGSGRVLRIVRRNELPRRVTAEQRRAWILTHAQGEDDGIEFPTHWPAFETLLVQVGGRLWVKEIAMNGGSVSSPSEWAVFDDQGHPVGLVQMPADFNPMEIGSDYVLGTWIDSMGIEFVQLYGLISQ